jgi:hypothetical protein
MAGNVYEWCQDWYGSDYYSNSPTKNPSGPGTGSSRVLRGVWDFNAGHLRVAGRSSYAPDGGNYSGGFRCVSGLNFTSGASAGGDFTSDEGAPLPLADDQAVTPAEEAETETSDEKETEVITGTTPVVEPEFKVSALASQKTAKVGANLSYVITLQGQGGFSQSLTLSVSGLPEKVETSFSSPTVKLSSNEANQVVELEVSVPDQIEAKTYDFTVSVTPTNGEAKTLPL